MYMYQKKYIFFIYYFYFIMFILHSIFCRNLFFSFRVLPPWLGSLGKIKMATRLSVSEPVSFIRMKYKQKTPPEKAQRGKKRYKTIKNETKISQKENNSRSAKIKPPWASYTVHSLHNTDQFVREKENQTTRASTFRPIIGLLQDSTLINMRKK